MVASDASDSSGESLLWKARALECLHEGVVIADARLPDHPLVYVNEGFCRITGYAPEEVLGRNCRFLRSGDASPETNTRLRDALRTGEPFSGELLNVRKNGERFWNRLHLSPVHDASGVLTHFVGIQLDVTELKRAECALAASRERLATAERFEALGLMASSVAHEINNPLMVIFHKSRFALKALEAKGPREMSDEEWEDVKADLRDLERMVHRVGKLVRDMQSHGSKASVLAAKGPG